MSKIQAQTPKGFRDFLPEQANAREFVLGKIKGTFKLFGFEPLETPALEYASTLKGKYGEEERLIYEFKTKGGDEVALRYDQTVPLARVIAQYPNLPKPFKRYQIQPVWRGESPQRGRYREFLQCDIDTVGSDSPLADAEIIACALIIAKKLGFKNTYMEINDRSIFDNFVKRGVFTKADLPKILRSLDKIKKIGREAVLEELISKGFGSEKATYLIQEIESLVPSQRLTEIFSTLENLGLASKEYKFSPTLARGLDYYTGPIFELISPEYNGLSLAGGGRYDKLIGHYSGTDTTATGISFGFDRLIEAMSELNLLPNLKASAKVLVTIFSPELIKKSLEIGSQLRSNNINTEIWIDIDTKLDKQLKYADQKGIPYVAIIGPEEAEKNMITLKNLQTKTQEILSLEDTIEKLSCRQ